jgi:L,D-transpeptidase ErfK/SrfK
LALTADAGSIVAMETTSRRHGAGSRRQRAVRGALIAAPLALAACGAMRAPRAPEPPRDWSEATFAAKPAQAYAVAAAAKGAPPETMIGRLETYRVREGDTLLDVARYFDLGYNEIVDANPGVDPWVPTPGSEIVLPTQWVLPCCTYDGIVVNIPEMRLYHYRRAPDAPGTIAVQTYPVGLGRDDRRTPRGTLRVRGKTENPTWYIPESIRKEHIAERGDHRRAIAGGAPDNPLGKHRIELADSLYAIHGTDIPWGVGMQVSHGCVRLYPEDIARWFPHVERGTPVRFVYQPVKAGARGGATFVEVHDDIYGYTRSLPKAAQDALARRKLAAGVDAGALRAALDAPRGVPVQVSPPADQRAGDAAQRS